MFKFAKENITLHTFFAVIVLLSLFVNSLADEMICCGNKEVWNS